ncbi:hypothetical protein R1sor_010811 [Riccia sorocarpa]|uniref:CCHC-type domain-containing protein n=1 Tax=Riccia sorocarpa TaxID=122646 RepID=A0ABD3HZ31_9MARC
MGTVLFKELVDNERGSHRLRAVVGTEIKEFPTTLEVPITTDFTIYVQLDYEGLHLRCFKCGSLDHKADDCSSGRKPEEQKAPRRRKNAEDPASSEETSSSTDLRSKIESAIPGKRVGLEEADRATRSRGTEATIGRSLWKSETVKLIDLKSGGKGVVIGTPKHTAGAAGLEAESEAG